MPTLDVKALSERPRDGRLLPRRQVPVAERVGVRRLLLRGLTLDPRRNYQPASHPPVPTPAGQPAKDTTPNLM